MAWVECHDLDLKRPPNPTFRNGLGYESETADLLSQVEAWSEEAGQWACDLEEYPSLDLLRGVSFPGFPVSWPPL